MPTVATQDAISETKIRGLGIYVTRKGVKAFFLYKKIQGKSEPIILAVSMTLKAIRKTLLV